MALGNNSGNSPRVFLSVGFGKLRQKQLENKTKVDATTPNAVKRVTQSGGDSWALEYDFISGIIENIFFKEDHEYGDSFEVTIRDAADLYQISFPEDSRYCMEFLTKLPKLDLNKDVKIQVYDFTTKEGKRKSGVSVSQGDEKIQSYYTNKIGENSYEAINGFPVAPVDMNWKDKDDTKIYFISVKKFLRSEFKRLFPNGFSKQPVSSAPVVETEAEPDDLPF
jgi:hypothetical protein